MVQSEFGQKRAMSRRCRPDRIVAPVDEDRKPGEQRFLLLGQLLTSGTAFPNGRPCSHNPHISPPPRLVFCQPLFFGAGCSR